jgi:hypothetical protein
VEPIASFRAGSPFATPDHAHRATGHADGAGFLAIGADAFGAAC